VCGCSDLVVSSPLWCKRHLNKKFRLIRGLNSKFYRPVVRNLRVLKLWHRAWVTLEQYISSCRTSGAAVCLLGMKACVQPYSWKPFLDFPTVIYGASRELCLGNMEGKWRLEWTSRIDRFVQIHYGGPDVSVWVYLGRYPVKDHSTVITGTYVG